MCGTGAGGNGNDCVGASGVGAMCCGLGNGVGVLPPGVQVSQGLIVCGTPVVVGVGQVIPVDCPAPISE